MLDRIKLQMNAMLRCCKTPAYRRRRRKKKPYTNQFTTYRSRSGREQLPYVDKDECAYRRNAIVWEPLNKLNQYICIWFNVSLLLLCVWQRPRSPRIYLPATAAINEVFSIQNRQIPTKWQKLRWESKKGTRESQAMHCACLDKNSILQIVQG